MRCWHLPLGLRITLAYLALCAIALVLSGCEPASGLPTVGGAAGTTPANRGLPATTSPPSTRKSAIFTRTQSRELTVLPTTTDRWFQLMLVTPYPWTTPLPPATWTAVDGSYAKFDPAEPQWWHCRRCADYLPAGGVWRLNLNNGVYRIYYEATGWRSLGSFALSEDQIYFFNDPSCMKDVGMYSWKLEQGELSLELIEDACAINMRAANFTRQPWLTCTPPSEEAAISDHWQKPAGCVE